MSFYNGIAIVIVMKRLCFREILIVLHKSKYFKILTGKMFHPRKKMYMKFIKFLIFYIITAQLIIMLSVLVIQRSSLQGSLVLY